MSEEPRPRNWFKITCLGCAIVPCLLGFATYGYLKFRVGKLSAELPKELAKLRAMKVPTEAADLAPKTPIADADNAALIYVALEAKIKAVEEAEKLPEIKQALAAGPVYDQFTDDSALVGQGLARREAILKDVIEAASRPECYFARDYTKGASVLFPEYAYMKQVCKWLALQAKRQAQAGDLKGALKSLGAAFKISGHLANEPTLIGGLVAVAINAIAMQGLEQVTKIGRNDQAFLAEARKLLETLPPLPDYRKGYGGELVMGRYTIQSLRSLRAILEVGQYNSEEPSAIPKESPLDGFTMGDPSVRRVFEAAYLREWRWVFEHLPANQDDWRAEAAVMGEEETRIDADKSFENRINQVMFPLFTEAPKARAAAMANRRVALLAIRVLQDRPHGYPADLSRYGSIAIDPMDGKPMRYKREGKGFKVWSIDRDLTDDFGLKRIPWSTSSSRTFDYVWTFDGSYPDPPKPTESRIKKASSGSPAGSPPPGTRPGTGPALD